MKAKKNFLDYVPMHNPEFEWKIEKEELVEVAVINKGTFAKIAQVVFKRPRISYIKLDKLGSFIWQSIDGEKSVYVIADMVKEKFGEEAEPLYERICKYFEILKDHKFITF